MSDKLPAPCQHCKATGFFEGSECRECDGKGYRLIVDGQVIPRKFERSGAARRRRTRTSHTLFGAHGRFAIRQSARNCLRGVTVKLAGLWDIFLLLGRHFRCIRSTRYAARAQVFPGDLVLGLPVFFARPWV